MASLKIEERFRLQAPPEAVWGYLTDAGRVVTCLPGASLQESSPDGRSHKGSVKVKLGAVTVAYRGAAEFEEVDDEARRLRMSAKGREKTGRGSVSMTMISSVAAVEDGSEVVVEAKMQLAGKIVQFGRGMIDVVSQELFKDFTRCLAANLEGAAEAGAGEGVAGGGEPGGPGEGGALSGAGAPSAGPDAPTGAPRGRGGAGAPAAEPDAVDGFALLLRAFRAWLRRLLGGR